MNLDEMEALVAKSRQAIHAEVLKNKEDDERAKEAKRLAGVVALERSRNNA